MSDATLATLLIGVTFALLVGGIASVLRKPSAKEAEDRLAGLTGGRARAKAEKAAESLLKAPAIRAGHIALLEKLLPSPEKLRRLYEQADLQLDFSKFLAIDAALAVLGGLICWVFLAAIWIPVGAILLGSIPFLFLSHLKNARIKRCMFDLPEAVELMGRALRAGHGLASGLHLVSQEMKGPLADEFGRVFEEQNLGIPMETALRGLADRVPVMDVRFLVTAIVIQRVTGGDLAEVLDKIGKLVRQRFELFGHVKALTAEGRLSGIVLLALPPSLLGFLVATNYAYVEPLFNTPMGTKLLGVTAVLQVVGAISIRKIVAIKV